MNRSSHRLVVVAALSHFSLACSANNAGAPVENQLVGGAGGTPQADQCGWPEAATAVSLTYDDAMPTQLSTAVPALAHYGLHATFFLTDVRGQSSPWSDLIQSGHELAAHTFNHPCPASNSWVPKGQANEDYDLKRMEQELDEGLQMLEDLGQPPPYTFAYPCGQTYVGEEKTSYIPLVEERFIAARGVVGAAAGLEPDFFDVPAYFLKSTGAALIASLDQAKAEKSWVVFGFHGVGGDWETIPADAHEELLAHLAERPDEFYVAPFGEIAACLQKMGR